jgi:hypothetical protein
MALWACRRLLCLILFSTVLSVATRAAADDRARARQLYQQGHAAFAAGHFDEAARLFESGFAASPQPKLLWNAAQAHRKQFEIDRDPAALRRARALYHNYAELAVSANERAAGLEEERAVETQLSAVEAQAARERAGAEAARLAARPAPPPSPPPAVDKPSRAPGYALLGVGAGLGLAGMGFGLAANADADTVSQTGSKAMPVPAARVADLESRGRSFELASYVFYGVGAAAVAAGVVLVIVHPTLRRAQAFVAPTAGGLLAGARW